MLARIIEVRTPAKAILAGEHLVLYGAPALAVPVFTRGLTLKLGLEPAPGHQGALLLPEPFTAIGHAAGELLHSLIKPGRIEGFVRISTTSDIPQGAGLGSSAAFAVALGRALVLTAMRERIPKFQVTGPLPDPAAEDTALRIAHLVENSIHGRASGIDTSAVASGHAIRMLRAQDGSVEITRLHIARPTSFLLVDTAIAHDTAAQIRRVTDRKATDPEGFARDKDRGVRAARAMERGLATGDPRQIHQACGTLGRLFAEWGMEPREAGQIRAVVDPLGMVLKITGAGGGGFLLGHAIDPQVLDLAIERLAGIATAFRLDLPQQNGQSENSVASTRRDGR